MTAPVVCEPEHLTSEWLSSALGREVDVLSTVPVGTGQIGACFRLTYTDRGGDAEHTVLAKLPAPDPGVREMLAGVYRSEVRFYAELANTVSVRVPECYFAAMGPGSGDFTLLLEDLAPAVQGDQIAGCSVAEARAAVVNLAGLHGPRWCDPTLPLAEGLSINGPEDAAVLAELYGPATDLFLDGLGDLVSAEDTVTLRECVEVAESWALARTERFTLMHGDYRLDNLMFSPGSDGVVDVWTLDWQTLSLALPARDLAYFLGTSVSLEDRRACEQELVAAYHSALVGHGVHDYSLAQCWDDYRFAMIQGPLVAVFGCAYGTRTQRGDQMFAAMVRRSCAAIRDHGTIALAPLG